MPLRRALPMLVLIVALASCGMREPTANTDATAAAGPCGAAFGVPNAGPALPTEAPQPTAPPALLPSPAPTEVVTPAALTHDDRAATAIAVSTTQPFPTAAASTLRPGQPAEAMGRRGGLLLTLSLPSDQLLAGEASRTTLTLHNDGSEPLFVGGGSEQIGWLQLLDEHGEAPAPWPWTVAARPGGAFLLPIAPGATLSATLTLQTPPVETTADQFYALWATTRFARAIPGTDGPDNIWLRLEAGPLPLALVPPRPEQQLQATLTLDRGGYTVRATRANGQPVPDAWGELEASLSVPRQFDAYSQRPLGSATGSWSGAWDRQFAPEQAQIAARAWVAAPGYVTAAVTETLRAAPLMAEELAQPFWSGQPPCRQGFTDFEAAQAALGLPVARLAAPPAGASLDGVAVEVTMGTATFTTRYALFGGAWLALLQRTSAEPYEGAGWGEARYDPEAVNVAVDGTQGYLVRHYDAWVLNWKLDNVGLELRAPVAALSADELAQLAAQVEVKP